MREFNVFLRLPVDTIDVYLNELPLITEYGGYNGLIIFVRPAMAYHEKFIYEHPELVLYIESCDHKDSFAVSKNGLELLTSFHDVLFKYDEARDYLALGIADKDTLDTKFGIVRHIIELGTTADADVSLAASAESTWVLFPTEADSLITSISISRNGLDLLSSPSKTGIQKYGDIGHRLFLGTDDTNFYGTKYSMARNGLAFATRGDSDVSYAMHSKSTFVLTTSSIAAQYVGTEKQADGDASIILASTANTYGGKSFAGRNELILQSVPLAVDEKYAKGLETGFLMSSRGKFENWKIYEYSTSILFGDAVDGDAIHVDKRENIDSQKVLHQVIELETKKTLSVTNGMEFALAPTHLVNMASLESMDLGVELGGYGRITIAKCFYGDSASVISVANSGAETSGSKVISGQGVLELRQHGAATYTNRMEGMNLISSLGTSKLPGVLNRYRLFSDMEEATLGDMYEDKLIDVILIEL